MFNLGKYIPKKVFQDVMPAGSSDFKTLSWR